MGLGLPDEKQPDTGRRGGGDMRGEKESERERQKDREKEQNRERERSKSQTKQQWLTLGKCISLFNLATMYFQSSFFSFFPSFGVCVLVMGSEQKTYIALLDS